jgi:MazG family protein
MPPLRAIPSPEKPDDVLSYLAAFIKLVQILRVDCPWDREQTHQTISHLLIEEAYETLEAIQADDDVELRKELGDILLHVVMHSVMAEQRGSFTLRDVVESEFAKLVNRHPHIFGDERTEDPAQVLENWEKLKMKEGRTSVLDGVPKALPAALRAQRVQEKAANVGFDWDNPNDVWAKVHEEIAELRHEIDAGDAKRAHDELGDVLFSIVNAARHHGIVAEDALHATINRFMGRFKFVEAKAAVAGRDLSSMSLAEMDLLWEEAKRQ